MCIYEVMSILRAKTLLSIVLLSMLLVETITAFHGEDNLVCDKCHVMHQSEDPWLLNREGITELCLTCHDGKAGTPDVIGKEDINGLLERSAGFFSAINAPNAFGHDLRADKVGTQALCSNCHSGGSFSTAKVGCIDCHDPHGRSIDDPLHSYRNLRSLSKSGDGLIFRAFVRPGVTGLEVYERRNIGYTAPDRRASDWREVTGICFDCHHVFGEDGYTRNPDGVCIRHPSTDSERGIRETVNRHGAQQTDPECWENGIGTGFAIARVPFIVSGAAEYTDSGTAAVSASNEVFCLTCHKAHGSAYRNSLRWHENSNLGCQQCHNKG